MLFLYSKNVLKRSRIFLLFKITFKSEDLYFSEREKNKKMRDFHPKK